MRKLAFRPSSDRVSLRKGELDADIDDAPTYMRAVAVTQPTKAALQAPVSRQTTSVHKLPNGAEFEETTLDISIMVPCTRAAGHSCAFCAAETDKRPLSALPASVARVTTAKRATSALARPLLTHTGDQLLSQSFVASSRPHSSAHTHDAYTFTRKPAPTLASSPLHESFSFSSTRAALGDADELNDSALVNASRELGIEWPRLLVQDTSTHNTSTDAYTGEGLGMQPEREYSAGFRSKSTFSDLDSGAVGARPIFTTTRAASASAAFRPRLGPSITSTARYKRAAPMASSFTPELEPQLEAAQADGAEETEERQPVADSDAQEAAPPAEQPEEQQETETEASAEQAEQAGTDKGDTEPQQDTETAAEADTSAHAQPERQPYSASAPSSPADQPVAKAAAAADQSFSADASLHNTPIRDHEHDTTLSPVAERQEQTPHDAQVQRETEATAESAEHDKQQPVADTEAQAAAPSTERPAETEQQPTKPRTSTTTTTTTTAIVPRPSSASVSQSLNFSLERSFNRSMTSSRLRERDQQARQQQQRRRADFAKWEAKLAALSADHTRRLEQLEQKHTATVNAVERERARQIEELQSTIRELRLQNTQLREEADSARQAKARAEGEMAKQRALSGQTKRAADEARADAQRAKNESESLRQQLDDYGQELERVNAQLDEARAEVCVRACVCCLIVIVADW